MNEFLLKAPRVALAHLPTPLEEMRQFSRELSGPTVYVKRDDCTGLGLGGNKVRKLEFLLGDALAQGADVIVTGGVIQSNHVRQTAAAAAKLGLRCHLCLMDGRVPAMDANYGETGNIFLTRLFGAECEIVRWTGARNESLLQTADKLKETGHRPYVVPYGGSNVIGALGYVQFAAELFRQVEGMNIRLDYIVHASGSAGTQAGLIAGLAALEMNIKVIGIDIDAEPERVHRDVTSLALRLADHLAISNSTVANAVEVIAGYAGDHYGAPTDAMVEAVGMGARLEGLIFDPVYSGKGLAGLVGLIRAGRFKKSDSVLFIHTGGSPAIFAYGSAFRSLMEKKEGTPRRCS